MRDNTNETREKTSQRGVAVAGHVEPRINKYYLRASRRYTALGILFMVALLVYIVVVMTFLGDYVTYENLKYLVRDFETMANPSDQEFSKIVYNASEGTVFSTFKNGLAVSNKNSFTYYDHSGAVLIDKSLSYSSPAISTSDKYMLLYDLGGNSFSVYNQLTEIISRETTLPIISGDVADNGALVIASRSHESKYVVDVYNSMFKKVMSIYKDNYVVDCAISPNSEYIVIASAVMSDTDMSCEIEICKNGKSEKLFSTVYAHTIPLDVFAFDDTFVLICDNGIYFLEYSGQTRAAYSLSDISLRCADVTEGGIILTGSTNALGTKNRVLCYDTLGSLIYDAEVNEKITMVCASEDPKKTLGFYITSGSVTRINPDRTLSRESTDTSNVIDIFSDLSGVLICSKNGAEYKSFSAPGEQSPNP